METASHVLAVQLLDPSFLVLGKEFGVLVDYVGQSREHRTEQHVAVAPCRRLHRLEHYRKAELLDCILLLALGPALFRLPEILLDLGPGVTPQLL